MKYFIAFFLTIILMLSTVSGQESAKKDSNYWVNVFYENQKIPYMNNKCECFSLDETIWLRYYGENEYFLSPSFKDDEIQNYYKRIRTKDKKETNFRKSDQKFIRILINEKTKKKLKKFNINVPDYVISHVLIRLPKMDIDELEQEHFEFSYVDDYGKTVYTNDSKLDPGQKEVFWSEDWEGSISQYSRGNNPAYWGDVDCESYEGNWSMWCADDGSGAPSSNCSNYVDNMDAYLYKTTGISVSEYSNVHFSARIKWDTEPDWDYLRFLIKIDGSNWTEGWNFTASSGGWVLDGFDLIGSHTNFWWRYDFDSDGSISNYEGAYVDNMYLSGTPIQLPNLTAVPSLCNLWAVNNVIDIEVRIINDGGATAGPSHVGYYLSTDETISTSDYLIGDDYVPSLEPGEYSDESISVDVSTIVPSGTYYAGFIIDYQNEVQESNEDDNIWYFNNPIEIILPNITLTPSSHNFGDITVGDCSTEFLFTLENTGGGFAEGNVSRTGANANQFEITDGEGIFSLSPNETKTIKVKFCPTSTGYKAANLFANGSNCNNQSSSLSGTGVLNPSITLTPSSHNFGDITVGDCSSEYSFTLKNTGGGTATGNVSRTGTNANQFNITSGGGSFSLAQNQTKIIKVEFCPTFPGNKSAALYANGSNCNNASSTLSGTGVAEGELSLTPPSHDFGDVTVGDCSTEYSFTLKNNGGETCSGSVSITGSNADQFVIISGGGSFSLGSNQTIIIKLKFCPTYSGNMSAWLSISSNCNSPSSLLFGTGVAEGELSLTPSSHDFGDVTVGDWSTEYSFTLKNNGGETCSGSVLLTGSNANQFVITSGGGSFSLGSNQTKPIKVKFCPTSTGDKTANLYANGSNCNNQSSSLSGTGIDSQPNEYITVITPNGGETWTIGTENRISWEDEISENVRIELYSSGSFERIIVSSTPSSLTYYDWTIPLDIDPGTQYEVKIVSVDDDEIFDFSDDFFEIVDINGTITINSPNGGESWLSCSSQIINWEDDITGNVRIDLYNNDDLDHTIVQSTESDGSFWWQIPCDQNKSQNYMIKITSLDNENVNDFSDDQFEIKQHITVDCPNSGEVWEVNTPHIITWIDEVEENVKIDLFKDGMEYFSITESTLSDGEYPWTPSDELEQGDDYKIKITSVENEEIFDLSDDDFEIINNTSIKEEILHSIRIFPIPSNDFVFIEINNPDLIVGEIKLLDVRGKIVFLKSTFNTPAKSVPVDNLKSGIYFLRIQSNLGICTRKIVVKH